MSDERTVEKKHGQLTTERVESAVAMMTDGVTTMAEMNRATSNRILGA